MQCSSCGVLNDAGRKFCRECGQRLAAACPACGTPYLPEDKFCGECGASLTAAPPAVAAPANQTEAHHSTERKFVSVLFVDLVGFTPYSEAHDAEDVRGMLDRYFESASDAVQRHGGRVEKFIGDAVMAVWGVPTAHEDDAERAVRAALEIVDRVAVLGHEIGESLQARAGVITGEAVATLNAVDQGFVTGDLVNTASRIQSAAEPGTVLVSDATQRVAGGAILFTRVSDLTLKGKAEPVPAWRADRIVGEVGGANRGGAPEPPFVGRDAELRLAKELLHSTGRDRRPKLLTIVGVAGIGKSRLGWELLKYIDGLTETFYWHEGRCPSYGDGVSFWALSEMVRYRARISDTDTDGRAAELLDQCLAEYVSDDDERLWLRPRLGHLIGIDPAPNGTREELFGAWRRFFERIAEHGTVVLAFEDLHWADPGLLDFVESLLEWSRNSPILVVASTRPELTERRPAWGSVSRNSVTLHLDRLSDDDIITMVTGYVVGLPERGLTRLIERAEGIPLYAVETLRMLADRGVLEQVGDTYQVVGELGTELDIPETLHALVAARLDGLPADERALVQDASVAGHSFTTQSVAAISGLGSAELETRLNALVRKEVLDQDRDPRSPERGQYRFVQSVLREVAYSTLSKSARRSRHLAAAEWLAALGDDELVGVVATHYLEAYRSEPSAPDAEAVCTQAREWLTRSAERALSLGSPKQAVEFAERAQSLATSPKDRADLGTLASKAAHTAGDLEASFKHLEEAGALYQSLGDAEAEAFLLTVSGRANYGTENNERITHRMVELAGVLPGPSSALATVEAALADRCSYLGRIDEALTWSDRAIATAGVLRDRKALIRAARARGWALANVERHWEAALLFRGVLELARAEGDADEMARTCVSLSIMLYDDAPHESLDFSLEAVATAKRIGAQLVLATAINNTIEYAIDLGRWDLVDGLLAEQVVSPDPASEHRAIINLNRAMFAAHKGEVDTAAELVAEAAPVLDGSDSIQGKTWYFRIDALCKYLAGDSAGALVPVRRSFEADPTGGNMPNAMWVGIQAAADLGDAAFIEQALADTTWVTGAWVKNVRAVGAAVLAAQRGDASAPDLFAETFAFFRDRGLPLDEALTVLCAMRSLPRDQWPTAEVESARRYLNELQAVALLKLYDRASS